MTSERKHPSAVFWATVAVVVALVAYPLSWGPACWLTGYAPRWGARLDREYLTVYGPLLWIDERCPQWVQDATTWYCGALYPDPE